jgi:hypothetical protein
MPRPAPRGPGHPRIQPVRSPAAGARHGPRHAWTTPWGSRAVRIRDRAGSGGPAPAGPRRNASFPVATTRGAPRRPRDPAVCACTVSPLGHPSWGRRPGRPRPTGVPPGAAPIVPSRRSGPCRRIGFPRRRRARPPGAPETAAAGGRLDGEATGRLRLVPPGPTPWPWPSSGPTVPGWCSCPTPIRPDRPPRGRGGGVGRIGGRAECAEAIRAVFAGRRWPAGATDWVVSRTSRLTAASVRTHVAEVTSCCTRRAGADR